MKTYIIAFILAFPVMCHAETIRLYSGEKLMYQFERSSVDQDFLKGTTMVKDGKIVKPGSISVYDDLRKKRVVIPQMHLTRSAE